MKSSKKLGVLVVLGLLVTGYAAVSPIAQAAGPNEHSEEVTQLLSKAETEALELKHDADLMASYARTGQLSWQIHAMQITLIKEHVNNVGELIPKLNSARDAAAPWQQKAIDQIGPLLTQLATNTTTTINHINEHKSGIQEATYRDYAVANYETAEKLAALISDFVDYERALEKMEALNNKLVVAER